MSAQGMLKLAKGAREASYALGALPGEKRAAAVRAMGKALAGGAPAVARANGKDVAAAAKAGLSRAMIGRLTLDEAKVRKIAAAMDQVAALPDPVGRVLETVDRPNGLRIEKISVPLGVLLIIYESRPNVTADCAALGVRSGNAVILKGGSEAFHSNKAIHACLRKGLESEGLPPSCVEWVASQDRKDVHELLKLNGLIDVVIPRGGETLIRKVAEVSKIPVIKHYKGVCHVYVDKEADIDMALRIAENAKVQNPGVCNAMETLLVHKAAAPAFLPRFAEAMRRARVELRADAASRTWLKDAKRATEEDWAAEYLDLILAVRVVDGVDDAIRHIRRYGSQHSDAIVSRDAAAAAKFSRELDSACVFVNCSTRFNDGGEFGMGAEIGISTDKLHARGPMGLRELTTYKYVVRGDGQIRT